MIHELERIVLELLFIMHGITELASYLDDLFNDHWNFIYQPTRPLNCLV